ncbi:hypothetical protein LEP1GSC058_2137 [Leptospira fainei serovar Hurstbridge str. BUT 6]|uniref:Lipoprotein n=1 Tax=Leptospira fainei serovar Hurstbridge str. BUT 6 TaxID=1193011 RepID=S3V1D6_9LEPT|nr:TIGR04452 family lipoprotein [Leptospira fainei]EPG75253.1 hypothetical protein LEP1GSC058_2137 [Leptospira fainei serovar Hurstbridge str. BUT 6]
MKRIVFSSAIFLLIAFANCAVLDPVGLTYDRIKGDKAASKITDAAITTDLVNSAILNGRASVSILTILASDIAGIDPTKYYKESVVNQCVTDIKGVKGYLIGSTLTVISSCKGITADGLIY